MEGFFPSKLHRVNRFDCEPCVISGTPYGNCSIAAGRSTRANRVAAGRPRLLATEIRRGAADRRGGGGSEGGYTYFFHFNFYLRDRKPSPRRRRRRAIKTDTDRPPGRIECDVSKVRRRRGGPPAR
ncbi:hypothetical protein EVAR_28007_1 [Eumeta japonica]|uniref:Uncharacterized protein n=1 Tax=Eumeta variegata TaxID=151549 RepID=A0A4C1WC34_EUMVA|nr:hypothetical protein EVAR_28007_1 [Eumeta japonica]